VCRTDISLDTHGFSWLTTVAIAKAGPARPRRGSE
jgi:hypothetical protein